MNRQLFTYPQLTKQYTPAFPCPSCEIGVLRRIRDSLQYGPTSEAKRAQSHAEWEPDWLVYTFIVTLQCSSSSCRETVRVVGRGYPDYTESQDEDGIPYQDLEDSFFPLFFHPALIFFRPPKKTPKEVIEQLHQSFTVFFCDPSAAANHVRSAIECLLTALGVPRFSGKGKRRPLNLHDRISKIPLKYQTDADLLLAVKWLGNAGSHAKAITRNGVLDAYDSVEHFLMEAYSSRAKYVRQLAKEINRRRGPRK